MFSAYLGNGPLVSKFNTLVCDQLQKSYKCDFVGTTTLIRVWKIIMAKKLWLSSGIEE
jgi:hypothetical protein